MGVSLQQQQTRHPNLIQGDWQPPAQGIQLGSGAVEMPISRDGHLETEPMTITEEVRHPENNTNVRFKLTGLKQKIEFYHKEIIIFQSFVILILSIFVGLLAHGIFYDCGQETPPDQQSCGDDGYSVLKYSTLQGQQRQMKYKVFLSLSNKKSFYNNVDQNCKDQKAVLWEILDGNVEWDAMATELNSTFLSSDIWLNGFILPNCTSSSCDNEQAKLGNGLLVRWSTSGDLSNYSRAILAASGESTCSYVQSGGDLLWKAGKCNLEKVAICVKRNCKI